MLVSKFSMIWTSETNHFPYLDGFLFSMHCLRLDAMSSFATILQFSTTFFNSVMKILLLIQMVISSNYSGGKYQVSWRCVPVWNTWISSDLVDEIFPFCYRRFPFNPILHYFWISDSDVICYTFGIYSRGDVQSNSRIDGICKTSIPQKWVLFICLST